MYIYICKYIYVYVYVHTLIMYDIDDIYMYTLYMYASMLFIVFPLHWISDATKFPKQSRLCGRGNCSKPVPGCFENPGDDRGEKRAQNRLGEGAFSMKGLLDFEFSKWISIFYDANLQLLPLHKKNRTSRTSLWVSIEPYGTSPN